MKKKLLMVLAILTCVLPNGVSARGITTVDVTGKNSVTVGETFKVDISLKDVVDTYDGVVSFSGNLSFDKSKLELVDAKLADSPYQFHMNREKLILAGLDFTLVNGIYDETVIYTFTFKAIDSGNTDVTIEEAVLTDSKDYIDATTNTLSIEINEKRTTTVPTTTTTRTTRKSTTTKQTTTSTKRNITKTTTTTKQVEEKEENIKTTTKVKNLETKENNKTITTVIKNIFNSIIESVERLFKRK